ncbi:MAG TPA: sialidase family protein [Gaiellaceae bacterium]|jgi:hypothetical protein
MNKRTLQVVRALLVIAAIAAIAGAASPAGQAKGISYNSLNKIQKRLMSGTLAMALSGGPSTTSTTKASQAVACGVTTSTGDEPDEAPSCPPNSYSPAPPAGGGPGGGANYTPSGSSGCAENQGNNVKVNQECEVVSDPDLQGRGQSQNEESIAADPNSPQHLVASQNDYRRGDGNCEGAYSLNGGQQWSDSTVPTGFTRGLDPSFARQYWEAGGDTSVGWDSRGNAYMACQVFNRGEPSSQNPDQSSAFLVFRSTQNDGGSWNFPGRYVTSFFDGGGAGTTLLDKELMAVDDNSASPFRDRIYVTWTLFAADGTAYIYEAHSSDYGETFSTPVVVSADSDFCTQTYGVATPNGRCNENQDSDPFVGPDGALYVAWDNFNNAVSGNDNRNQILLAKSTDGGQTFSAPVKATDYYDLPDCYTNQGDDPGRACVPEKGSSTKSVFRATNYPSGAVNPKNPNQVVVTVGSYINKNSNESNGCVPAGFSPFGTNAYQGVKTPGACNNDILLSVSNDGGASFTGGATDPRTEATVNQSPAQATTDQWFQWAAFTKSGKLAVDYYDRQYGSDETTGWSDITLSGSKDLSKFADKRVTSSSMPPPTQFYSATGGVFYGDYIMLDTAGEDALPIWSDTRDPELFVCPGTATTGVPPALCTGTEGNGVQANDENTYMARMGVPTK